MDSLERAVHEAVQRHADSVDLELVMTLAKAYQDFSYQFPDDSMSCEYTFRCAQLMEGSLNDAERAAELYKKILSQYPGCKKAGAAAFFLANAYHTLGKKEEAIDILAQFSEQYPNHPLTQEAQLLLEFIESGKWLGGNSSKPAM